MATSSSFLTMVYHDVEVDESLAQRLNVDLSETFVKIENLDFKVNYSIQFEQSGGCGEDLKSDPVYVVTGGQSKVLFSPFLINCLT